MSPGLGWKPSSLETSASFFKHLPGRDSLLSLAPISGELSLLATPVLTDPQVRVPWPNRILFPSLLSDSLGSSQDIFILTGPTPWVTTLSPTSPTLSVLTTPLPNPCPLEELLPGLSDPASPSEALCPERNPSHSLQKLLLILHLTSVMRSSVHHPVRGPGTALAACLSFPLGADQPPTPVTSASVMSLKPTLFSLCPLQLPTIDLRQRLLGLLHKLSLGHFGPLASPLHLFSSCSPEI